MLFEKLFFPILYFSVGFLVSIFLCLSTSDEMEPADLNNVVLYLMCVTVVGYALFDWLENWV